VTVNRIVLSLELCEKIAYGGKRVVLYKDVMWPSIPPEDSILVCGVSEDGEQTGFTATIKRVYWEANGDVAVGAGKENIREEYDNIVTDIKRDGFLEYEDWKKSNES